MAQARDVCDYIEGRGSREAFLARFAQARRHFDPDRHLARIGVANQTTMLARESLAIGEAVGQAMARARGATLSRAELPHLRHDLQRDAGPAGRGERAARGTARRDARDRRLQFEQHDLARGAMCGARADLPRRRRELHRPGCRHGALPPPEGSTPKRRARIGCRSASPVRVGITAGASTPNNKIGETVARILATRGLVLETV